MTQKMGSFNYFLICFLSSAESIFLSLGVSTVETNFWKPSRMSIISRSTFFLLVRIFKIETFQSRLGWVKIFVETVKIFEIFEICRDFSRFVETFWDLSRLFEIYRDISTLSRPPGLNFSHHLSMIYEWTGKVRDTVT